MYGNLSGFLSEFRTKNGRLFQIVGAATENAQDAISAHTKGM